MLALKGAEQWRLWWMDPLWQFSKCGLTVSLTMDDEKDLWEELESQSQEREEKMARWWFWTVKGRNGGNMMKAETQIKYTWNSYKGQLSGSWRDLVPSPLSQGKLPQFWGHLVPDEKITSPLGRRSTDGHILRDTSRLRWPKWGGGGGTHPPRLGPQIIFNKPLEQGNVIR